MPSAAQATAAVIGNFLDYMVTSCAAYRPFDGTDSAVADVGEVEIEFQPIGVIQAGTAKALSDAIFNYASQKGGSSSCKARHSQCPKEPVQSVSLMAHS